MNNSNNNLIYLPSDSNYWFQNLLNQFSNSHNTQTLNSNINFDIPTNEIDKISETLSDLYKNYNNSKLHIYDSKGTIAVLELENNLAWLNEDRRPLQTDFSFNCEVANINALTRVNRRTPYILNDLVWNLFWNTPEVSIHLCNPENHYKIYYWPKPFDMHNKKNIFQMSACFIQGGKISTIAETLNLPLETVQRFIGACISTNNIKKINAWDPHYAPTIKEEAKEEVGFIKSFFSNLRSKLHL